MDDIVQGQDPQGLFSKRSSSNILSDPRILAHLRIVAEEAQSSENDADQDDESELQNAKRELGEKIAVYNKGSHHGAFRLILKEDLSFEGALRFYFEDGREELMKTVRLTNKTLVSELLPSLIEKFKPDLVNSSVEKKAKLYVRHEEDEICLDPSDAPLDIALNAKKLPRFVLRLDIVKPPQARGGSEDTVIDRRAIPNGTALNSFVIKPSSPDPSLASVHSTGSDTNSTASSLGVTYIRHDSPISGRKPLVKSRTSPKGAKGPATKMSSSTPSWSEKGRNFLSSPRSALGMFFDGGGHQQDQSSHAAQKVSHEKRPRKRSIGLKLKKQSDEKSQTELSTNQMTPGILKVFGDHVSPGSNYKSVRATEMTTADEIVMQALDRYSLSTESASDYVLCDVIGYFAKRKHSAKSKKSNMEEAKWITEYARVIGDKEKPLVLQQLWKPIGGFSRRFELQKQIETQDLSFFKPRGSIALMKHAAVHEVKGSSPVVKEVRQGTEESDSSHFTPPDDHLSSISAEDGESSGQASLIVSTFIAPMDTPYLLLLKGFGNADDLLYHRLDEQIAVVGRHAHHLHNHGADIILYAPDILLHHSTLSKVVETSSTDLTEVDGVVNFTLNLEPFRTADVCINGVVVSSSVKLNPGDLVSFGKHYLFLFKDPTQVADNTLKLPWIDDLKNFHRLQMNGKLEVVSTLQTHGLEENAVNGCVNGVDRLRLPYHIQDEDDLISMITQIIDLPGDAYKLSPAYLLIMCLEHSARYHTERQTRQLLLKISNTIQTIASEKTSEMSKTIERTTEPEKALDELLPQLGPVIFWMANCLEMLPFLQHNMSRYVADSSQTGAECGDEDLCNADEEILMFLEEVVIYTFQQTVYHLTKVLYIVLPAVLDTNPFQDSDEGRDKKPQEVETVVRIFQTTYDVVRAYCVHDDIVHQLFAYLFFFTNASLFNTLMERGSGGKFYRWAKGAQIRGNLDLLESWAAEVKLQDEANEYLSRLSTAADLLATPKVQLLQADWTAIRRDFPALNAAQVQQLLGEYQLGPGKSRPRGWFPPPEEVEPALRTSDILLSFADHPALKLPTEGYVLDLENGPSDSSFYVCLDAINQAMNPGGGVSSVMENSQSRWTLFVKQIKEIEKLFRASASMRSPTLVRAHQPEPELRTLDHVPKLVVSPTSPRSVSPSAEDRKEFSFQTVIATSPPSSRDDEAYGLKGKKSPFSVERRETPPKKEEISTTLAKENTAEPSASFDFVRGMKPSGYKHMSHSDSGSKQLETKPRSPGTSSLIGHEDGHHSGDSTANSWKPQKEKDVTIAANIAVNDEHQNVAVQSKQDPAFPYADDNSKWVEVTGAVTRDAVNNVDGLSVLPMEELVMNAEQDVHIATDPNVETSFDQRRALQKAMLINRLKNESDVDMTEKTAPRNQRDCTVKLEGMREYGDRQDDVFIVELEKGDGGIGLGLIDGLYTTLRAPGIYVRTLVAGGPAMKDGRLRLGDRILAVNGTSLVGADYQSAMQQIRQAGNHLSFLVAKSDIHVAMQITASSC